MYFTHFAIDRVTINDHLITKRLSYLEPELLHGLLLPGPVPGPGGPGGGGGGGGAAVGPAGDPAGRLQEALQAGVQAPHGEAAGLHGVHGGRIGVLPTSSADTTRWGSGRRASAAPERLRSRIRAAANSSPPRRRRPGKCLPRRREQEHEASDRQQQPESVTPATRVCYPGHTAPTPDP